MGKVSGAGRVARPGTALERAVADTLDAMTRQHHALLAVITKLVDTMVATNDYQLERLRLQGVSEAPRPPQEDLAESIFAVARRGAANRMGGNGELPPHVTVPHRDTDV